MKCLVIAASGYIGNAVAERLLIENYDVIGSTRSLDAASKLKFKGIQPLIASIEEQQSIIDVLPFIDAVIYCAYGYNSIENAQNEVSNGTTHLDAILQAMAGTGKTFILTSGTGVIPDSANKVYDESTPLPPTDSPVVMARRNLEQRVQNAASRNINSVVLRPPCVHGRNGSFIVPRYLLDYAMRSGESIYVEGTENNKRAAVHVDDFADLVVLSIKNARAGSLYCTGAEHGITTLSIAESVSRKCGIGGKATPVSLSRAREIFGHWGDWWSLNSQCSGDLARKELGWNPQRMTLLEDIEQGSYALT